MTGNRVLSVVFPGEKGPAFPDRREGGNAPAGKRDAKEQTKAEKRVK